MRFKRPTGLMFHHFHGLGHPEVQGSISADDFGQILDYIGENHTLLPARVWYERALDGSLSAQEVCLTFDDALACQYDIALPVLDSRGLTGFWFVYTAILAGGVEPLEIFRHFRTTCFSDIDAFYCQFFKITASRHPDRYQSAQERYDPDRHYQLAPFYTDNDKWFRYVRDRILTFEEYGSIMETMMEKASFSVEKARRNLWLSADHVKKLSACGHIVGLHSHTHPTAIASLCAADQKAEYVTNADTLHAILGTAPETVSHPCNSYNEITLDILGSMGVMLGFRADTGTVDNRSPLEFDRQDHAIVHEAVKARSASHS